MTVRIFVFISMLSGFSNPLSAADEKRELLVPLAHSGYIKTVAFTPDGKSVFTGSVDGSVRLWDIGTGKTLRVFQRPPEQYLPVAYARDGKHFLVKSVDHKDGRAAEFFETASGKSIRSLHSDRYQATLLVLSDNGKRAIIGDWDALDIIETDTGKLLKAIKVKSGDSATFSPDGNSVLTGSSDGIAHVWEIESGEVTREFKGHKGASVKAVAYSPDGKCAITGGRETAVRLWDVVTGREIKTFEGHEGTCSIAYSPDGKRIVTGDMGLKARIFDVASGKLLHTFRGHNGWVNAVAFSPKWQKHPHRLRR